jgi:hypothetical protein
MESQFAKSIKRDVKPQWPRASQHPALLNINSLFLVEKKSFTWLRFVLYAWQSCP